MLPEKTPLKKINLESIDVTGVAFIKDESVNPYGTIKDRRNKIIIDDARRHYVDKIALITSGNNGYSLSQFTKGTDIEIACIISRDLPQSIKRTLLKSAHQVIEKNLDDKFYNSEEVCALAREREREVIWDATNGYEEAYIPILKEILAECSPTHIVVPVGSGSIFVAFADYVHAHNLPIQIIGIGPQNTRRSFADKLYTPWTPYLKAMRAFQNLGHLIYRINEETIRETFSEYQNIVPNEPSSAIVFAAPRLHRFLPSDTVVFLNTGRAIFEAI